MKEAIQKVVAGELLSRSEAAAAMETIMTGGAEESQIGALVTALSMRGESEEEIAGFAETMRRHARKLPLDENMQLVDSVGTGGGGPATFNISTVAAFIAAGAGARVAKHGNRAMTSKCGAADVLEGLGAEINLEPERVAECIEIAGIGFMMAPVFHPAMRFAGPTRRSIGIRTIFNVLGPLTNPAGAKHLMIGVSNPDAVGKMARVLHKLDTQHALVVHGTDGLDELTITGDSTVYEVYADAKDVPAYQFDPQSVGFRLASLDDITGGTVEENVATVHRILNGEPGAARSIAILNAAGVLYAADLADSIASGVTMATESVDSGAARDKLQKFVAVSNRKVLAG